LAKLLDDVRARRVDVIVVYKVDRLTRSLADFAKLVELFDDHDVSFISVTQAFNTTTSMGRLTLNMLLSFAQFEREITGERIRDKVAASKKRGIWMGGAVPFGYRVENRALHVVEEHAEFVRELFRRYLEVGSVVRLKIVFDAENVRLPVRVVGTGKAMGGGVISRGHIYWILSNPIYVGRLRHKGQIHDGLHAAIVDQETWDRVQHQLAAQTQPRADPRPNAESFLAGKLYDDRGNRMGPSHAAKGGQRWRYYVSRALLKGREAEAGSVRRVPAAQIERQVAATKFLALTGWRRGEMLTLRWSEIDLASRTANLADTKTGRRASRSQREANSTTKSRSNGCQMRTAMFDLKGLARLLDGDVSGSQVVAPGPGHSRKDRSLSVGLSPSAPDGFIAFSHAGDDWRESRDYVRERTGLPRRTTPRRPAEAPRRVAEHRSGEEDGGRALSFWRRRQPIVGSFAERYLREARGYDGPIPATLGFLPPWGEHPPAMTAALGRATEPEPDIIEIADAEIRAVHLCGSSQTAARGSTR
jgi:DNA invertase Pin-like site-specific DNA recombinase